MNNLSWKRDVLNNIYNLSSEMGYVKSSVKSLSDVTEKHLANHEETKKDWRLRKWQVWLIVVSSLSAGTVNALINFISK